MTAFYFTVVAVTSWLHIIRPEFSKTNTHTCGTVLLHLALSNGLVASVIVTVVYQTLIARPPLSVKQGPISYLIHGVVAVLWCVDFGMSAMPLPAVHCFGCVLTLSAFISTSFFVPNMKQDPPYPFLNPKNPTSGAFVFGVYCLCYSLYFIFYAIWICCKHPECGCHYREACYTFEKCRKCKCNKETTIAPYEQELPAL